MSLLHALVLAVGIIQGAGWTLAATSTNFQILDSAEGQQIDIQRVADSLCADNSDQIARISTFHKLADYMKSPEKKHSDCARKYATILGSMSQLISIEADGICTMDNVDAIGRFVERHIGRLSSDPKRRKAKSHPDEAPRMLANFFLHHAYDVTITCRHFMLENMKSLKSWPPFHLSGGEMNSDDFWSFSWNFNSAEDPLLMGNWVDIKRRLQCKVPKASETSDFLKAIQPKPESDHYSLFVEASSTTKYHDLQRICESKFRPIYHKLILPLEKLKNLGFPAENKNMPEEPMSKKLRETQVSWYRVTQICETLRPIAYVGNWMKLDKSYDIVSREQVEDWDSFKRQRDSIKEIASRTIDDFSCTFTPTGPRADLLRTVEWENTSDISKVIEANAKRRESMVFEMMIKKFKEMEKDLVNGMRQFVISGYVTGDRYRILKFHMQKELDCTGGWRNKVHNLICKPIDLLAKSAPCLLEYAIYAYNLVKIQSFEGLLWAEKYYPELASKDEDSRRAAAYSRSYEDSKLPKWDPNGAGNSLGVGFGAGNGGQATGWYPNSAAIVAAIG